MGGTSKRQNGPPPLAFGCKGGGGGGRHIETPKLTTSGSRLDAREEVVVEFVAEMLKRITSSSRLGAREEVVVANVLKRWKGPPPARV